MKRKLAASMLLLSLPTAVLAAAFSTPVDGSIPLPGPSPAFSPTPSYGTAPVVSPPMAGQRRRGKRHKGYERKATPAVPEKAAPQTLK